MVDMAVRDENLGQGQLFILDGTQDAFDIATWINHDSLMISPEADAAEGVASG